MTKYEEYTAKVDEMPTATKAQRARKEKALELLASVDRFSGAYGCIDELLSASKASRKTAIGKQGETDFYIRVNKDGKISNQKAERKTNGGRIGDLLNGTSKAKYIVYSMDICNAGTSHKRRVTEPKLFSVERFLELLDECNATKSTNGNHPETAIQATSKSLYLAMLEQGETFEPGLVYDYYTLND
jgi:hypothetical protein